MSEQPRVQKLRPLRVISPTKWHGQRAPARRWLIEGAVLRKTVCLFTGSGGTGKSLLSQQLMTCACLGQPWLGYPVTQVKSFGIFSEDPADELQRRQDDISDHMNIEHGYLEGVDMMSLDELDDMALYRTSKASPDGATTVLWHQIVTHVVESGAQLVILDNVASLYQANANYPEQVGGFMEALKRLARDIDGAVILLQHPGKDGEADGSGLAGSRMWRNWARSHMHLSHPKEQNDQEEPTNERIIKLGKNNYGPRSGGVRIEWREGVFVPLTVSQTQGGRLSQLDRLELQSKIIIAMRKDMATGQRFSMTNGARNQVAALLRKDRSWLQYSFNEIKDACEHMIDTGKLVLVTLGGGSRATVCVRPADARYPGEAE